MQGENREEEEEEKKKQLSLPIQGKSKKKF